MLPALPDRDALCASLAPATRAALDAIGAAVDRSQPRSEERRSIWLFGESLASLLAGGRPRGLAVLADLEPAAVVDRLPQAVPTDALGRRFALGSATGSIDLLPWPRDLALDALLASQALSVHALALAWNGTGPLHDPFGGAEDLARARLRWLDDADCALTGSPVLAWVAARAAAEGDLTPDPECAAVIRAAAPDIDAIPATRLRRELTRVLLGRAPARGLALLRESGAAAALLAGWQDDLEQVVPAVPARLPVRLAALLRGTSRTRVLRRLQAPRPLVARVAELLALHPIDQHAGARREPGLRRLLDRLGRPDFDALLALREAELAVHASPARPAIETARGQLAKLRIAADRLAERAAADARRPSLAIDGRRVMDLLGCGPGRQVGEALQHLRARIAEVPEQNTPEALEAALRAWADGRD